LVHEIEGFDPRGGRDDDGSSGGMAAHDEGCFELTIAKHGGAVQAPGRGVFVCAAFSSQGTTVWMPPWCSGALRSAGRMGLATGEASSAGGLLRCCAQPCSARVIGAGRRSDPLADSGRFLISGVDTSDMVCAVGDVPPQPGEGPLSTGTRSAWGAGLPRASPRYESWKLRQAPVVAARVRSSRDRRRCARSPVGPAHWRGWGRKTARAWKCGEAG